MTKPAAPIEQAVEATVRKKLDKRLLVLTIAYGFALMDRSNLGAVKAPLMDELSLSEDDFALATGIFFVFYLVLEVPSNAAVVHFGPRKVLSLLVIVFGMIGALQAAAANLEYVSHFLLPSVLLSWGSYTVQTPTHSGCACSAAGIY